MKSSSIVQVRLDEIRIGDERFRLTTGNPDDALKKQIELWGCLSPPTVVFVDGSYVPVSGFKRLAASMEIVGGSDQIAVTRFDDSTDVLELLGAAARDVLKDRPLGPFEVARGLERALRLGLTRERIDTELLKLFGLDQHPTVSKRHLKLSRMSQPLARHLEATAISLKRALSFVALTRSQAALAVALANRFKLSARALEEWTRMISDIARRDDLSWSAVIESEELLAAEPGHLSEKQGRKRLWRVRYPNWAELDESARRIASEISPSDRVVLSWDDRFETDGIQLTCRIQYLEEFRRDVEELLDSHRARRLEQLLELLG
jgi:hypothetical protein